ncbi:MAG: hypothetical protein ACR2L5_01625 [Candidatus Actinomarinaceae bacterium]
MKRVRKLTPATLKRIIAEEKTKLRKEELANRKPRQSDNKKLISELRLLLKIRKQQNKRLDEVKKLNKLRKMLKNKLIKRI